MDGVESDAETTQWTRENLEKLIASMKDTIPEKEQTQSYIRGLKALEWDKVAFPPFSPEECRVKWNSMMGKMRRFRSLPELLDEAEHVVSDPVHHRNIPKQLTPPKLAYMAKHMSRYKKKHPGLTIGQVAKKLAKKYDGLPEEKKMNCMRKYTNEFSRRKQEFCIDNNLPIPRKSGSKRIAPKDGGEGCSKDEGLPEKPPPHGRALFLKEQSEAGRSSFGSSFLKDMSQRWKEMSENEKQMYNTRCEKMKREYETKLIECLDGLDEEKQRIIKEKGIKFSKKTLDRYARLPGEPKLPRRTQRMSPRCPQE
ncbi:nucleolar transcription factor 1-like [Girardinichthys multiradiatus]|uniref:nucleolar transcription factor 1-like n=1 Tax=Girardinichthys multiradiatus TaxID=208333 RepID=UPI001FAB4F36|nr:nucleolar transcription factor 1-like [Girardinichthys multiradiatus]XP_047233243.1 nucleolar transcription factor 1-like [Girardinichthys multiradiatus]